MTKLILMITFIIASATFSVSATEGQGSGVLGPEVKCTLQDGTVIKTYAQICVARKGS
ncbi:MAG: hypothetical protein COB27_015560 [Moritella sp.]|uniref:hypothetical protein n=1 Tax=unclassified Moritella TaxID=2637987 RepID=UPI00015692C1|nr:MULTISPECIES: hypothetical protein [unclassified Moritella]EDM65267.1 hypothetical protein PE36_11462 [Moritella sp. PE36]MBL1418276.1 hypothetical protein [Moritella sp.]